MTDHDRIRVVKLHTGYWAIELPRGYFARGWDYNDRHYCLTGKYAYPFGGLKLTGDLARGEWTAFRNDDIRKWAIDD